jgi:hypothetical protein
MNKAAYIKFLTALNGKYAQLVKKHNSIHERMKKRHEETQAKFPGKMVVEVESIEDMALLQGIRGEIKTLKYIKRLL